MRKAARERVVGIIVRDMEIRRVDTILDIVQIVGDMDRAVAIVNSREDKGQVSELLVSNSLRGLGLFPRRANKYDDLVCRHDLSVVVQRRPWYIQVKSSYNAYRECIVATADRLGVAYDRNVVNMAAGLAIRRRVVLNSHVNEEIPEEEKMEKIRVNFRRWLSLGGVEI